MHGPVARVLVVGMAVLSVSMVALGAWALIDVSARTTSVERSTYSGVRVLVVREAGSVTLTGAPAGAPVRVLARVTRSLRSPERGERREGDTLVLDSSCPFVLADTCAIDYEIAVPPEVRIVADASGGDVRAHDLRSTLPIRLRSSAGDVEAERVDAPELDASSSAGDVRLIGLRSARIEARTSAGDVRVEADGPFERLIAYSSAGDVAVLVPDDVYDLDARSSAGDIYVKDVRADQDAPRRLDVVSSAGDVRAEVR